MKALKISSDPDEKKELKAQFTTVASVAERIKSCAAWVPPTNPAPSPKAQHEPRIQRPRTKSEEIGEWADDVALSSPADSATKKAVSRTSSSLIDLSQSGASAPHTVPASGNSPSSTSSVLFKGRNIQRLATDGLAQPDLSLKSLVDPASQNFDFTSSAHAHTDTQVEDGGSVAVESVASTTAFSANAFNLKAHKGKLPHAAPSATSFSHIRRLAEPTSSRKRTKKEEIILLKASVVNGFKCPPWDKAPASNEFVLEGYNQFT